MAAVNESSIRVTANTAPFQADMRRAAAKVKSVAKVMGDSLGDHLGKGFKEGKQNAKEMLGSVRDITSQVLTLGGAVSGGAMVITAVNAKKANIALANVLSVVQGRVVSVAEAHQLVNDAAMETGESMDNMRISAQNLTSVAKAGMDLGDAIVRSTKMAQRFNVETDTMSEIFGRVVGGGFADSLDEAEALIEQVGVTMLKSGVAMEDAFNVNDMMEFFAKMSQFGVPIQAGIVLLEQMEGTVRDLGEALELPEELGEMLGSTKGIESITAASKLTSKELSKNFSIAKNLVTVLEAGPKAFKVLQAGLGEKATIGFERLLGVDIIEAASRRKLKTGELQDAVAKVEDAFTRAAKVQFDATAAAQRNAELTDTAAIDFQNALTKMEEAFQTEEVTNAIKSITEKLPEMVDGISSFVSYAVDNPWSVVSGLVGAKLALAVGGSAVQSAVSGAASAMFARVAAAQVATAAVQTATIAGAGTFTTGAAGVGGALAAGGAATAAAMAAGAVAAGVVGFGVGTLISKAAGQEESMDTEMVALRQAQFATSFAETTDKDAGSEKILSALASLEAGRATLEGSQANMFQRGLAGAASIVTGEKSPEELRIEAAKKIDEESNRLIGALMNIRTAAEGATRGLDSVKEQGGGGTTRGTDHLPQRDGAVTPQG